MSEFTQGKPDFESIVKRIAAEPGAQSEILGGLSATQPRIKYGCLKALRLLSENQPAALYPHFDQIATFLESENKIPQWGAILILGNLAAVDSDHKIDELLERYLRPISGPTMITAANTIQGAGKIAQARPELADRVFQALLQVKNARYQTPECRNVALGHVLKSLELFFEHVTDHQAALGFARQLLRNRRNAVRVRARGFLKKHMRLSQPEG